MTNPAGLGRALLSSRARSSRTLRSVSVCALRVPPAPATPAIVATCQSNPSCFPRLGFRISPLFTASFSVPIRGLELCFWTFTVCSDLWKNRAGSFFFLEEQRFGGAGKGGQGLEIGASWI